MKRSFERTDQPVRKRTKGWRVNGGRGAMERSVASGVRNILSGGDGELGRRDIGEEAARPLAAARSITRTETTAREAA